MKPSTSLVDRARSELKVTESVSRLGADLLLEYVKSLFNKGCRSVTICCNKSTLWRRLIKPNMKRFFDWSPIFGNHSRTSLSCHVKTQLSHLPQDVAFSEPTHLKSRAFPKLNSNTSTSELGCFIFPLARGEGGLSGPIGPFVSRDILVLKLLQTSTIFLGVYRHISSVLSSRLTPWEMQNQYFSLDFNTSHAEIITFN